MVNKDSHIHRSESS